MGEPIEDSRDAAHWIRRDLHERPVRRGQEYPYNDNLETDAIIVGGGFSGMYCLHMLRKEGLRATIYEAGTSYGGIWRFNCYPGARVDTEVPSYALNIPEVWSTWTWSTNYPDWRELQAYFDHMDKVLDLSKDTAFETVVTGAQFNEEEAKWTVKTADGRTAKSRFLILGTGFASKRWIPDWEGLDKFKGTVAHSSFWPTSDVDVKGKKCAVIGTGASGVQVTQEWGQMVGDEGSLLLFQRTPNLACPMGKRDLTKEEQDATKPFYNEILEYRERTFAGFPYDFDERNTFDVSPEERRARLEWCWQKAGFHLWLASFQDYLFDMKANRVVYDFWYEKTIPRVKDQRKRDLLCPKEPLHAWGIKRPSLEQCYFEQFNKPNVDIVDISLKSGNKIESFDETGINTSDGKHYDLDVVCIATGFDAGTGGLVNMGLKNVDGVALADEWKGGAYTYLGISIPGYPNCFTLYGPHGPTAVSNGPPPLEIQARWVRDAINLMNMQNISYIDPTREAAKKFKERINELSNKTLMPTTMSTYMGSGIPGKPVEQVNYTGGLPAYKDEIRAVLGNWEGFRVVKSKEPLHKVTTQDQKEDQKLEQEAKQTESEQRKSEEQAEQMLKDGVKPSIAGGAVWGSDS